MWALASFAVTNCFKSPSCADLVLDRANNEFGLVYTLEPGTMVMAQWPETDEPVYFAATKILAACLRTSTSCKKICLLLAHYQLDLVFETANGAADFTQLLGRLVTKVGNQRFEIYEATSNAALARADFTMEKECQGLKLEDSAPWTAISDANASEWAKIYKAGKCSDFTVIAGGILYPVHRVLLCSRSEYFNAVCDGRFSESEQRSITLPEDAKLISTLLQELYGVYNSTTGSIFTNFALLRALEKELVMSDILALFIAADKYAMQPIKHKVAETIIDRIPFIYDPLSIVDLASNVYQSEFPEMDCGLRKSIVMQLHSRLPAIMADEEAWKEYAANKEVVRALHEHQCELLGVGGILTPPSTPTKR
ncbi:hypothetical protein IAQ61_006433 [Plenodomus lingam]|uniref:uncharacterized protein n=1 Tax=Leptosphaeria maculans TaxID=5022 RepID=UPI00331CE1E2|nr:hypothetical protein IAQ61_006433 [Plenodomus lingam]